jgi:hypothetical protein
MYVRCLVASQQVLGSEEMQTRDSSWVIKQSFLPVAGICLSQHLNALTNQKPFVNRSCFATLILILPYLVGTKRYRYLLVTR